MPAATLSKAAVRAATALRISQATLADVLGVSRASVSGLVAGSYQLEQSRGKEWELALLLVRLFRSLDAIVGPGEKAQTWMMSESTALNEVSAQNLTNRELRASV
ncbi:antitoxin Xre-like helix-turn-helix domain-containing protein [Paraburkholderia sp. MM6662-R1]|uniref:antitoxin Xre-like helix-turn-helix domain-containing protein n=1 Tax=Paraburkholderia sp. MM6662-R1 TaxID=2991066 RepID=UPI003D1CA98F